MAEVDTVVPESTVEETINSFTALDESGDKRSMNKLARRLGKDQPALLQFAAKAREEHGDTVGEASLFYSTLVWAMYDLHFGKKLDRLMPENLEAAQAIVDEQREQAEGLADKPIHEQACEELVAHQPHIYAKLRELIEEDVREKAMTEETAQIIYPPTQMIVEAFDAALAGRSRGQRLGPVVREAPKVGRNEPCTCGSGKKFKKCCGAA